jgi:dethiobiotin synthetase
VVNERSVIVAGIGTEVGKTVVSAILCEVLGANYWKPIASGADDGPAESASVSRLLHDGANRVFGERYLLRKSLSPHAAAALDGVEVSLQEFTLPVCERPLVVELAGGILVPLNDTATNIDLIRHLKLPVVVVSRHYLGSINHTLLTLQVLRYHDIPVRGVIFNGEELPDTERIISTLSDARVIGRVPTLAEVTAENIGVFARSCGWAL